MAETPPLTANLRRRVPSVDQALQRPDLTPLLARHGRPLVLDGLREELAFLRGAAATGDASAVEEGLEALGHRVGQRLARRTAATLVPVINASGVVIHTNLGRAPLSQEALARVAEVASGYSNLELDLDAGERGDRETHAETRLRRILGCPATLVVNNNAAAVLLAINTLAEGQEVLVSRGELVEIGGSFRIPDVIRKGAARMREVGTTNRTRISDYRDALGPESAALLRVHRSNFRMLGFTEDATRLQLIELAREARVPLIEDLGSGLLAPLPAPLDGEETVGRVLDAGVDVVTFSGDKLLGGPQAGLVAGRRDLLARMRRNPLYRALRVDKMTLAALDVVLADHESDRAAERIPVLRMLHRPASEVGDAAARLFDQLGLWPGLEATLEEGVSAVGGGAAPGIDLPTTLLRLRSAVLSARELARALRLGQPPVIARVADDALWLDLRTVTAEQEGPLLEALRHALSHPTS
jgi:L-seryl-tRNA(Ser) seleniumtransferase